MPCERQDWAGNTEYISEGGREGEREAERGREREEELKPCVLPVFSKL